MRLPRARVTVRGLMVAVAVVALLITAERMLRIRRERLAWAAAYADEEAFWQEGADAERLAQKSMGTNGPSTPRGADIAKQGRDWAAEDQMWADRFSELRRRYERGARYPWLHVEPDPLGMQVRIR